jgi:hypothetical protein
MSRAYEIWLWDQLNPDDKLIVRYHARKKSTWADKMKLNIEDRRVDEKEQEKFEDEYLRKHGVI